jgi:hypothetical protein
MKLKEKGERDKGLNCTVTKERNIFIKEVIKTVQTEFCVSSLRYLKHPALDGDAVLID